MSGDECVLDRAGTCVRTDDRHGYEWDEIYVDTQHEPVAHFRGPCKHLRPHVVPVETGGRVVAHLCTTCDAQLP